MTLCASLQIRGVFTSDNEYDFVSLPSDMRFKFPFDNSAQNHKWAEYFDWLNVPGDWLDAGNGIVRIGGGKGTVEHTGYDAGVYR
jgi:hypothetical protein